MVDNTNCSWMPFPFHNLLNTMPSLPEQPLEIAGALDVLLPCCWGLSHVVHQAILEPETDARHLRNAAWVLEQLNESVVALWQHLEALRMAKRHAPMEHEARRADSKTAGALEGTA